MPDETKNKRNSTAQNDGSGKYEPQHRNANEENQHTAGGKDRSCDAPANHHLRQVNLRFRCVLSHIAPLFQTYHDLTMLISASQSRVR